MTNQLRKLSPLLIISLKILYLILCSNQTSGLEEKSRVRVFSQHDQEVIEEAASLSLDLPVRESATNEQELSNETSSLGYRQVSLASLTLHQHQKSDPTLNRVPRNQPDPWIELNLTRIKPSWLNISSRYHITGATIEEIPFLYPAEFLIRRAFDSPILLRTKLGIIEGVNSIKFNKHLYTFLSIPYAKPPIGDLRFKAPEKIEKWDGIYQATKWPPFCVQPSMTLASKSSPVHILSRMMSEDCLYLNIWTPSLKFNKNHKRPVMVWIHGGGFQYGGISVDENDGSALALLGDVVVVTFNYRISAFGFLNARNPKNGPNNVGLLDQQLALEWVNANIRQFGGDPQAVTLFGESAGGHAVGLHMISPKSQPLFKRAILQSGVPISFLRSYDANNDNKGAIQGEGVSSVMMAKRLKCYLDTPVDDQLSSSDSNDDYSSTTTTKPQENNEATIATTDSELESEMSQDVEDLPFLSDVSIACLRNKSSLDILKALGSPGNSGFFPTGDDAKGFFPNGPIMDSFDSETLKVGPQKDYLFGINSDEGTFMLHYGMASLFPAKSPPKVSNIEELKSALVRQVENMTQQEQNSSEVQSASGSGGSGAQAHLYRPLLRTSSTILENFMPKQPKISHENGTNTSNNSSRLGGSAEFGKSVGSLITDIIFLCPARSLARTLSESGRNVYFYLYTHRSSLSQYHEWIGVTHHDEVEFVFGRPLRLADVYSGKDIEMSQRMIKTWSHFAYTGQMLDQLGVKWPKYDDEDNNYMVLNADQASTGERYHDRVCNVYDTIISVHLQDN